MLRSSLSIHILCSLFVITSLCGSNQSPEEVSSTNPNSTISHVKKKGTTKKDLLPAQEAQNKSNIIELTPEEVEAQMKLAVDNLNAADQMLEDLAQKLNNNLFPKVNKDIARLYITTLRTEVNNARQITALTINITSLTMAIRFNELMISVLGQMIRSGLQELPDIRTLISRSIDLDSREQIEAKNSNHKVTVDKMDKEAISAGLNVFRRGYRNFEKFWEQHKVGVRVLEATALIALSGIAIALIDKERFSKLAGWGNELDDKSISSKNIITQKALKALSLSCKKIAQLKSRIGSTIEETQQIPLKNGKFIKQKVFIPEDGTLMGNVWKWGTAYWPVATALYAGKSFIPKEVNEDMKNVSEATHEKWHNFKNFLRGGAPRKLKSWEKRPDITLDDVIGMDYAKKAIAPILDYLQNSEKYDQAGIQPPKGILLYGPSRTGKSFFAEALSGSIKKMFENSGKKNSFKCFSLSASQVMEFEQLGYGGMEYVLRIAEKFAPCVVIVDELDLLGLQREVDRKMLSQFLSGMSGCVSSNKDKQVIVIGATNKPEQLDFALKQPGRLEIALHVGFPVFNDRLSFFKRELEKRCINTGNLNIDKLARETEGCTYEHLNGLIRATLHHARSHHRIVCQDDFEKCLDSEVRHILPLVKKLPQQELNTIATHQAGHALATFMLKTPEKLIKVTTLPVNKKIDEESIYQKYYEKNNQDQNAVNQETRAIEYGKCFTYYGTDTLKLVTTDQLTSQIKLHLSGFAAEKIALGTTTYLYHTEDKQEALELAKKMVFAGMKEQDLPKSLRQEKLQQAITLVDKCEAEVTQLMEERKEILAAITQQLLERHTLTAQEVNKIIDPNAADIDSTPHSISEKELQEMAEAIYKTLTPEQKKEFEEKLKAELT